MKVKLKLLLVLITIFISGCSEIKDIFYSYTPHQKYRNILEESGLIDYNLGKMWIAEAEKALKDSFYIALPYNEESYFTASEVKAYSYRFHASKGEIILIKTEVSQETKIFLDLFISSENMKPAASADSLDIKYLVEKSGEYLLRIQPELLKSCNFTLIITMSPSLAFPVKDLDAQSVLSFWGDPRDAGRREHQGIDIFAERGTPAIASSDGIVYRTGTNRLGGNVVWLHTTDNYNLYYAHLDTQLVNPGQIIRTGDTLGLIGNTGNAITTPPHLHFGIYIPGEGAVDPFPFVNNLMPAPMGINTEKNIIGNWGKVRTSTAELMGTGSKKSLKKGTAFKIKSAGFNAYRILLPDGTAGLIGSKFVEQIQSGKQLRTLTSDKYVYEIPDSNSVIIDSVGKNEKVNILAEFRDFLAVEINEGIGWVKKL